MKQRITADQLQQLTSSQQEKLKQCAACNGSGYYDNIGSPKCSACNGTGKVRKKVKSIL